MRTRTARFIGLVSVLSLMLVAFGAAAPAGEAAAPAKHGFTFGVAFSRLTEARWKYDLLAMQTQANKYGDQLLIQSANTDLATQVSQVEQMITAGAKVIILFGVSSNGSAPVISVARQAHVPVIAYDLFLTNVQDIAYALTRNDYTAGKIQVQAAVKAVPKGNYVLVKGDPTLDGAKFAAAYPPVLKPYIDRGDIKIVSEQWNKLWSPQSALQQAEQALTANQNNIQAMLTTNDGMATGVIQALKAQHLQGKVFVSGLDADPENLHYLALGWQTMDIWSSIDKEGRQAVKAAHLVAQGKSIPRSMYNAQVKNGKISVPTWYVPTKELTTKNLCSWLKHGAPPGWVALKDVYKGIKQPC